MKTRVASYKAVQAALRILNDEELLALADNPKAVKKFLKEHSISEDEEKRATADVQKVTDAHIKMIDELQAKKDQELLGK